MYVCMYSWEVDLLEEWLNDNCKLITIIQLRQIIQLVDFILNAGMNTGFRVCIYMYMYTGNYRLQNFNSSSVLPSLEKFKPELSNFHVSTYELVLTKLVRQNYDIVHVAIIKAHAGTRCGWNLYIDLRRYI